MTPEEQDHAEIRAAVRKLCAGFPGAYWRRLDRERAYPTEFVAALTQSGFLAALIPEEYGGAGLPLSAAAAILEEIHRSGCSGAACHAQIYVMGTLLRHGSEAGRTLSVSLSAAQRMSSMRPSSCSTTAVQLSTQSPVFM